MSDVERCGGDPYATCVPPGKYCVSLHSEERFESFGKQKWALIVTITDGPHQGDPLWWFLTPPAKGRTSPANSMARAFVTATGLRPPRDLYRRRPSTWLAGVELEVDVVAVTTDSRGIERPEALSYSRVDRVVRRTAGSPPVVRERMDKSSNTARKASAGGPGEK